jgi:diguanylate cyclase (GGDEF)-like protein
MRDRKRGPRLPRWSLTRWLVDPGGDLPPDIRLALINGLYGSIPIFVSGVINTIAVSAVIAARLPSALFLLWTATEILLGAVRLPVLLVGRRAVASGRRGPTDLYLLLSVMWAASVGFGAFLSLSSGDWVAATLACISAAAMVGGICFRNFGAPRLVAVMIVLSLGPCAIGAVMSGQPILLIAALQIPLYLYSMTAAAYQLNRMLVRTMRSERENEYIARHDTLTGVLNRHGLTGAIEKIARADAARSDFALFYLDLDGFKIVNDTLGHAAGDQLLIAVAKRLEALVRAGDAVARIGGDEFVVLSRNVDRGTVANIGQRIIASVAETGYRVGDEMAFIGVSVGVALQSEHGDELASLLEAADEALYRAKTNGTLQWAVATRPRGDAPVVIPFAKRAKAS